MLAPTGIIGFGIFDAIIPDGSLSVSFSRHVNGFAGKVRVAGKGGKS